MGVLGVVLAGGLSRRMGGGDKCLLQLGGRTLLERVAERFAPQCDAGIVLNANGDPARFSEFGYDVVADGVPGHPGPLAGILAGLDRAAGLSSGIDRVASVSGDAPFLPRDLVARLSAAVARSGRTPAIAASGERRHFTVALWPVSLREDLRVALVERDERRVGAFIARYGAEVVSWPVGQVDPFLNVNTADDLAAAQACLSAGDAF